MMRLKHLDKKWQWVLLLAVTGSAALLIAACSFTDVGQSRPIRIVAFGDSTTAERGTIDAVYTDRLPEALMAHGIDAVVINAGMRGSHTGTLADNDILEVPHGLERLQEEVIDHAPHLVIIQFGINDAYVDSKKQSGDSRIPLGDYVANLTYMIDSIRDSGAIVMLMTPNQLGAPEAEWQNERLRTYAQAMRKLAKAKKVAIIDTWKLLPADDADTYTLDGMHPNDLGHKRVAERLATRIAERLRKHLPRNTATP